MKLEYLRSLYDNATPGPWKNDSGNGQVESEDKTYYRAVVCDRAESFRWDPITSTSSDPRYEMCPDVVRIDPEADMEFIAYSRAALPLLLNVAQEAKLFVDSYEVFFETYGGLVSGEKTLLGKSDLIGSLRLALNALESAE